MRKAFGAFWLLALAINLGLLAALIYVAHHFIAKYW